MTALNKQEHQTENERMAQSLAERNGEPVEGLRQRISELEEIATDYGMKFQKAQDALKHQSILHKSQLEAAEKRIAELEVRNGEQLLRSLTLVLKQYDDYGQISLEAIEEAEFEIKTATAAGIGVKGE